MKSCNKYLRAKRPSAFKIIFIVISIMAITYFNAFIVCAQGLGTSWSVFRHDSLHTGRSTLQGPDSNNLKWSFHTENIVDSSAVLDLDGTIYIGSQDKSFYAIKPDGILKWTFKTNGVITSSPAIDSDGNIYFGSWDKKLYALSPDGIFLWSFTTGGVIRSSPTIGPDRTIYFGSSDGNVYAIGEK